MTTRKNSPRKGIDVDAMTELLGEKVYSLSAAKDLLGLSPEGLRARCRLLDVKPFLGSGGSRMLTQTQVRKLATSTARPSK